VFTFWKPAFRFSEIIGQIRVPGKLLMQLGSLNDNYRYFIRLRRRGKRLRFHLGLRLAILHTWSLADYPAKVNHLSKHIMVSFHIYYIIGVGKTQRKSNSQILPFTGR